MIGKRFVAVAVAVLVSIGVAAAPSAAEGEGYSVPARGTIEFTPASNPLRVTAPAGHLLGASWVQANAPIRLANGKMSAPNTVYLRFEALVADDAAITQSVNGRTLTLTNLNGGDPGTAARIGGAGATVDVWTEVISLDLCVTAETFYTIINGYKSKFGTQLASVLALVAQIFTPVLGTPAGSAGPCVPLVELLPLLSAIVQAGVPLPDDLPAENIEIRAYAVNIAAPAGSTSLDLPVGQAAVENV